MELIEMMKTRRSIRKYTYQRVEREKLDKILEAGLFAPNPGGGQSTKIVMLDDPALIEKIGVINADCENRNWGGRGVSEEQLLDMAEEEPEYKSLDKKTVMFLGNSFVYYGYCVMEGGQGNADRGYFYQICKNNGESVFEA